MSGTMTYVCFMIGTLVLIKLDVRQKVSKSKGFFYFF